MELKMQGTARADKDYCRNTHVCKKVFGTRLFPGKLTEILPAILNHASTHHAGQL